jgi:lysine-specific demethylase 8
MNLPTAGTPYDRPHQDHARSVPLALFVAMLEAGAFRQPCYMNQIPIERFSGLTKDFDLEGLRGLSRTPSTTNLWLGSAGTRSGLHYDSRDNFLAQFHGCKRVLLADPRHIRAVYPFPDNFKKSQVDPDAPDLHRFPRFASVPMLETVLRPGDILFVPKLWLHHVVALATSISVNHWHGPYASAWAHTRLAAACGLPYWRRFARDFWVYGVCRRPHGQRLFAPPPTGKVLFDELAERLARAWLVCARAVGSRRTEYRLHAYTKSSTTESTGTRAAPR